jgi:hypothetical protein
MGSIKRRTSTNGETMTTIDKTIAELRELGFLPGNSGGIKALRGFVDSITGEFNSACKTQAYVLWKLASEYQPITVRGLMYRAQAAGVFPDTSTRYYEQAQRILLKLRRIGKVDYDWIVDSTRRRLKPSCWSGLADFAETAAEAYRRDLWSRQKDYIEFFVEKDAMAGILEPITEAYDVHLNVIRGQVSETFAWNIAEEWKEIEKPIFAYYLGDHDPAGLRIEASLKSKLEGFLEDDEIEFDWERLAITPEDFANTELLGFKVKRKGKPGSWLPYLEQYGDRCIEIDALEPNLIRDRLKYAIESHIDVAEWRALQATEKLERATLKSTLTFKAA